MEFGDVIEEVSAFSDKKTLLSMYDLATKEPFSFLFIKFMEKDRDKMCMIKFTCYLTLKSIYILFFD